MRYTVALALALCSATAAADYLIGKGKGGGIIILEADACDSKTGWREGRAQTPEGKTLDFCWTEKNNKFIALYEDGRIFEYPPALFQRFSGKPPRTK